MEKKNKFKKPILVLIFFIALEALADYYVDKFPQYTDRIAHIEASPPLPYHIRKNIFADDNYFFAEIVKGNTSTQIKGEYSLFGLEGLVRHAKGDTIINKWGYEGPYFNKIAESNIFRIITLGDSTTLGEGAPSEANYPRHLERMLNSSKSSNRSYQVLNFGHWGYGICDVRFIFEHEALQFKPDMILIMAGSKDATKLGTRISSSAQFCNSGAWVQDVKWGQNLTVLLKDSLMKIPRPRRKPLPYRFQPHNLSYYKKELQKVIRRADQDGISVGLISLPTELENNGSLSTPSFCSGENREECESDKKRVLLIQQVDKLYQELAKSYLNVFYINNGVTLNAEGKKFFFKSDKEHLTGSGNRILAYSVKLSLNDQLKIDPELPKPFAKQTISSERLEIEYLKSLFLSNKIEDLICSGCIVFNSKCIYTDFIRKKEEWTTSAIEFSLGSFLQFEEEFLTTEIRAEVESLLRDVIIKSPDFSLSYWVLAQILFAQGKNDLAKKYESASFQLNPLLKDFDFGQWKRFFNDRHIDNPIVSSLKEVIVFLKTGPKYNLSYLFANSIIGRDLKSYPEELNLRNFKNLYYSSPLLVRSIYKKALDYLVEIKDYDRALELVKKIKTIKPEYSSFGAFSNYEKKIESLMSMKGSLKP
jgi:tetratricopeptide (TPR) repeat protein